MRRWTTDPGQEMCNEDPADVRNSVQGIVDDAARHSSSVSMKLLWS